MKTIWKSLAALLHNGSRSCPFTDSGGIFLFEQKQIEMALFDPFGMYGIENLFTRAVEMRVRMVHLVIDGTSLKCLQDEMFAFLHVKQCDVEKTARTAATVPPPHGVHDKSFAVFVRRRMPVVALVHQFAGSGLRIDHDDAEVHPRDRITDGKYFVSSDLFMADAFNLMAAVIENMSMQATRLASLPIEKIQPVWNLFRRAFMREKDFIAVREELEMVCEQIDGIDANIRPLRLQRIHDMDVRNGVVVGIAITQIPFIRRDAATMDVLFLQCYRDFLPTGFQIGDSDPLVVSINHQAAIGKDDGGKQIHGALLELEEFQIKKSLGCICIDMVDAERRHHVVTRHGEEIERVIRRVP